MRLLVLAAGDVPARERREEQPGRPVVAREPLQKERAVRVLLGLVVLAARDRELRERGEREAELQRVLRAVGDVAALERARLCLGEAAHPREHERRPEHRTAREQRVVVCRARVRARRPPAWPTIPRGRSAPTAAPLSAVVARA